MSASVILRAGIASDCLSALVAGSVCPSFYCLPYTKRACAQSTGAVDTTTLTQSTVYAGVVLNSASVWSSLQLMKIGGSGRGGEGEGVGGGGGSNGGRGGSLKAVKSHGEAHSCPVT